MIQNILLERVTGDGRYTDVLIAAFVQGKGDYGSSANALAVMVRQSPLFKETVESPRFKEILEELAKSNGESERPKSDK